MVEHDELPVALRDAARVLREPVAPTDIWRQRVLRAAHEAPPRAVARRTWSVRPWQAIAAAVVCVLVGGAAMAVFLRGPSIRTREPALSAANVIAVARPDASLSQVRFTIEAPGATKVSIVGDFNGWDPSALPLRRATDGRTWVVDIPLAPGRYAYSFVVDGALARDPSAPQARDDDFGSTNSIVMVRGS